MASSRFIVGIDLGTTNTVVAYADRDAPRVGPAPTVTLFPIAQRVSAGASEARDALPSCLFAEEHAWIVGAYARARGPEIPGRFVASSKSWLAHAGVDRHAAILPWGGGDDDAHALEHLSPVDASAAIVRHVVQAWDAAHPDHPLAMQRVVLTLPASFDEAARALTLTATARAGLVDRAGNPVVRLLEEPQAALLDWVRRAGDETLARLLDGEAARSLLVCDVGGGTSDFSLVRLSSLATSPGGVELTRVAVGEHLLLGGDNVDLALARAIEPEFVAKNAGQPLTTTRFAELVLACRDAKERLLARDLATPHDEEHPDALPVTLLGRGSRLVGGTTSVSLTRAVVDRTLASFFPAVTRDELAVGRPRRAGIVSFGLPYATDPAITRHLARFLLAHRQGHENESIALLLNGGVFHAHAAVELLAQAVEALTGAPAMVLGTTPGSGPAIDPDHAVARGAVAYGLSLEGIGRRIGGGSSRSFFVGVSGPDAHIVSAVCVLPRGAEPAVRYSALGRRLALLTGTTARFALHSSRHDATARAGDVVTIDETYDELPPVVTAIASPTADAPGEIEVHLESELSELGTLDLYCVHPDSRTTHRLAFELRGCGPEGEGGRRSRIPSGPVSALPRDRRLADASARIERVFGKARSDADVRDAKSLARDLEKLLGPRAAWPLATIRPLADALLHDVAARRRSPEHERTFWSLAGFLLRPGFGDPLDGQRLKKLTPLVSALVAHGQDDAVWRAWWIGWRRLAGGLDEACQVALRDLVDPFLEPDEASARRTKKKPKGVRPEPLDEVWRLVGALERLPRERRSTLGAWILERTWTSQDRWLYATLGRLGARVPAYASAHHVIAARTAEAWLNDVLRVDWKAIPTAAFAATQLAQKTGDRALDVSDAARASTVSRLEREGADASWVARVRDVVAPDDAQRRDLFGDDWPIGLRLIEDVH